MQFMKYRKWGMLFSLALILISVLSFLRKGFHYGIDFTGGILIQVKFKEKITSSELRKVLSSEFKSIIIQRLGLESENQFILKTKYEEDFSKTIKLIEEKLLQSFGEKVLLPFYKTETVGPTIGKELRNTAFVLIFVSLIAILIYISIRFKINFAFAAVLALVHDVVITLGFLSITEKEIDIPIIAALLTIVGYSINDTIVVFDRIREYLKIMRGELLDKIIDASIKSTLTRTFFTSLTTLFAVFSIFILGGPVLHNFAFTLLIGIIVGTYSSIFIASPLYYAWEKRIKKT